MASFILPRVSQVACVLAVRQWPFAMGVDECLDMQPGVSVHPHVMKDRSMDEKRRQVGWVLGVLPML